MLYFILPQVLEMMGILQPSFPSFSGIFEVVLDKTTAVTMLAHLQIKKPQNISFLSYWPGTQTQ